MAAAAARRLDVLVWLHENSSEGCLSCVLRAVLASIEGSRVSLNWLRSRVPPGPPCQLYCLLAGNSVNSTARAIVERGDVQAMDQLSHDHFNDLKRVGYMLAELATNRGDAEMHEWFYIMFGVAEREFNSLARHAACQGNLDVLQELHAHHPEELTRRLQTLAKFADVAGHDGILAWLEKEYQIQLD